MKENPEAPGAGAGSSSGTEVDAGTQPVRVLPPAGPEPRGAPPSSGAVITVALLLCAVGALCIHELLVFHGIVDGAPWLANSFTWIAQLTWRDWMRYAAPAAVIVGIVSLIAALRPRRRTHVRMRADLPIWLTPTDVARACSARADRVDSVSSAETTATRAKVVVTVSVSERADRATPDDATLERRVRDAVEPFTAELAAPPKVGVKIVRVLPAADRGRNRRVQ